MINAHVATQLKVVLISIFFSGSAYSAGKADLECRPNEGALMCEDRRKIGSTLHGIPNFLINLKIRACLHESGQNLFGVKTNNVSGEYLGISKGGWDLKGMISFQGNQNLPDKYTPFVVKNRKMLIEGYGEIRCNF